MRGGVEEAEKPVVGREAQAENRSAMGPASKTRSIMGGTIAIGARTVK
jgi:hypothetical protein